MKGGDTDLIRFYHNIFLSLSLPLSSLTHKCYSHTVSRVSMFVLYLLHRLSDLFNLALKYSCSVRSFNQSELFIWIT